MTKTVEFFYDYVSPYSYLADHEIGRWTDVEVVYRPMYLGAVMKATGNRPPAAVPAKGAYLRQDLTRWSKRYGLRLRLNSIFPQNTIKALRLAVVAQQKGGFATLHAALFEAMFVYDRDLADVAVLEDLLGKCGLDAATYLEAIDDPAIKALVKTNTDEAVSRGVFGAPTFFVGEEMFFGNDRFGFMREALGLPALAAD